MGSWVKVGCTACGGDLFLSATASSFRAIACRHCGGPTPPPLSDQEEAFACYEMLRSGLAGYTKDCDFGMISWEQMESGWTHGVPGGRFPGFDTRTTPGGWLQVRLPKETLCELTRTPSFVTWQGDRWLFQGGHPMIYVGEWKKGDFEAHAPSGMRPEEFFTGVIARGECRCDGTTVRNPRNDRSTGANEGNEEFPAGEQPAFGESGANSSLSRQRGRVSTLRLP